MSNEIIKGKPIRCYDNGDKTLDRYTVVYMFEVENEFKKTFSARGMSTYPCSPQGFGCYTSACVGRHLGKRIKFQELPKDCQELVNLDLEDEVQS